MKGNITGKAGANGRREREMPESAKADAGTNGKRAGVFVVDVIPLICDGLAELFDKQPDLHCCGRAAGPQEALSLFRNSRPKCVVTAIGLGEFFGLELIRDLKAMDPAVRILVFSLHDEAVFAERALHAGAHGYLHKRASRAEILNAVRHVLGGNVFLSPAMSASFLNRFARREPVDVGTGIEQLSDREIEIFELIGRGLGPQEIAERLHLGVKTVESYKTRIKDKLGIDNARHLLQHAVNWATGISTS